jgi:hypothetical protein
MYFVHMYENRAMNSFEIVPRRTRGAIRENDGGGEPNQGTL